MKKLYFVICSKYRKFEKHKISYLKKHYFFLLFVVSVEMKTFKAEKIFKEEQSLETLRILGLINNIEEYQKK